MSARRNRPVLYEMVRHSRRPGQTARPRSGEPAATETSSTPAPPRTTPPPKTAEPTAPRTVRVIDGHVSVRLGWPGLAVLAVGAIFVLFVAFQAGARFATTQTGDLADTMPPTAMPIDEPPQDTPAPVAAHRPPRQAEVVTPRPVEQAPAQSRPAPVERTGETAQPTFEFKRGYHYVVVQHFRRADLNAAQQAASFLHERGVPTELRTGSDVQLIAREPFLINQDDTVARAAERRRCDALKQRIREIGKEYAKEAGYDFKDCYERVQAR